MLTSATPKATMNSANKRRRLNDNAATLSKPFHSPLKVNNKKAKLSAHDADDDKHEAESQSNSHKEQCPIDGVKGSATTQETASSPVKDKDVTQLQREYAALSQDLKHRRQNLDMLQQALNIRTSNQQEKLDKLIIRWRLIAREVADEVYTTTSAQVKDMGGLQAIKKHSQDFAAEWSDTREGHSCLGGYGIENGVDGPSSLKTDGDQDQPGVGEVKSSFICTFLLTDLD